MAEEERVILEITRLAICRNGLPTGFGYGIVTGPELSPFLGRIAVLYRRNFKPKKRWNSLQEGWKISCFLEEKIGERGIFYEAKDTKEDNQ